MTSGLIFDLRRYSIHDGPGIRTTVFFKGCPLACAWCHNPESRLSAPELMQRQNRCILCGDCLEVCPHDAVSRRGDEILIDRARCRVSGACAAACPSDALQVVGTGMTTSQVMAEVERDRAFYETSGGGVTFSGGEPLAQFDFLFALLTECRRAGIHAVLDTSGHAPWSLLKRTIPLVGLYLYDLKLMDEHRHLQWTGVSNADILANLKRLSGSGSEVLIRIPLIPGINDDEQNLRQTAEFMAGLDTQPLVELLPYHNIAAGKYSGLGREDPLPGLKPSDPGKKEACAALLREYDIRVVT